MRKFYLNKLVRDGVFESMQRAGQEVDYKVLDDNEVREAAKAKVAEELAELDLDNPNVGELIDLATAVDNLVSLFGIDPEKLEKLKQDRIEARGSFAGRIFVRSLVLKDDDPWANYYAADPNLFPEVPAE